MQAALSGLILLLFVIPGFAAGRVFDFAARRAPGGIKERIARARNFLNKSHEWVLRISLYALLLIMGIRLVEDPKVVANLPVLGLQAICFAGLSVLFSVLATLPFKVRTSTEATETSRKAGAEVALNAEGGSVLSTTIIGEEGTTSNPGKLRRIFALISVPALLLGIVGAGALMAALLPNPVTIPVGDLTSICLRIMLLAVGLGLGFTPAPHIARSFSKSALFLPIVTAIASLAAGLLSGLTFLQGPSQGLTLAAGFGWYSLSAVMISDLGQPAVGALAFLCNLFRESIALLSIPLLQRIGKTGSAISAAGATSMDVALPILSLYGASSAIPLSVYHGFVLSLLVPVLVPIFLSL